MPRPPKKRTLHILKPASALPDLDAFWVDRADNLQKYTPGELLCAFERGEVAGDTLVRIKPSAPSKPLRVYIRELVWLSYQDANQSGEEEPGQETFKRAFDRAPIGVVLSDLAGRIQHANEAFCTLLGYTEEALIGMRVGSISETTDRPREVELGNEVLAGIRNSFEVEKRFRHRDGSLVETLLNIAMIQKPDGTPSQVVAHVVDLTRRKRLERQLSQAERLKSIGKLAGGIAHDFNNILQVFIGGLPLLAKSTQLQESSTLNEMRLAAEAGTRLTRQLMAFTKQGAVQVEAVDLNQLLTNLQPMIQTALGRPSTLVLDLSPHPLLISANSLQLEQAIMNMAFNAAKAMVGGGQFTIQTRDFLDEQVALVVKDTGVGMDPQTLERAFEPYFTTRRGSGGTGLGLSMVHGIVTRFGGSITLESQLDHGTTCTILWPRHTAPPPAVQPAPPTPSPVIKDMTRTLVVDDEPIILRMIGLILQRDGHEVAAAGSVQAAVSLIEDTDDSYDLLVCDVCLQDGDGSTVTQAARQRWPGIPVLHISGFTGGVLEQDKILSGEHHLLSKPFRPKELMASVRAILQPSKPS
jgi:PAS domain S-box-containing protein